MPGTDDQVDVVVTVKERPPAVSLSALAIPRYRAHRFSSVQQDNFIGSGKRLGLGISYAKSSKA